MSPKHTLPSDEFDLRHPERAGYALQYIYRDVAPTILDARKIGHVYARQVGKLVLWQT